MSIGMLLEALSEEAIARHVGLEHDEARLSYRLTSNRVPDFDTFIETIADYYNHHFTRCVSSGGRLTGADAAGRAKEILEREYRRRDGTIVSCFQDARDGAQGGMRVLLDVIAEGIKAESVERYVQQVFRDYVDPSSWEQKVSLIREFLEQCGPHLSRSIDLGNPERYAHDYTGLIRAYVQAIRQTSSLFRKH